MTREQMVDEAVRRVLPLWAGDAIVNVDRHGERFFYMDELERDIRAEFRRIAQEQAGAV